MQHTVFISYRREDTGDAAARIHGELEKILGSGAVFLDQESIPVGEDFSEFIASKIQNSKVVLVLIGPRWVSIADERTGERRLDSPSDLVRIEVERALASDGVHVIPVLINNASMPREDEIAPSIGPLVRLNSAYVRRTDFNNDIDRLIGQLESLGVANAASVEGRSGYSHIIRRNREAGEVSALWARLATSTDEGQLQRFAETYPGTVEAFDARNRAQLLKSEKASFAAVRNASSAALREFVQHNPNHHLLAQVEALIPAVEAKEKELREKQEAREKKERDRLEAERREENRSATVIFVSKLVLSLAISGAAFLLVWRASSSIFIPALAAFVSFIWFLVPGAWTHPERSKISVFVGLCVLFLTIGVFSQSTSNEGGKDPGDQVVASAPSEVTAPAPPKLVPVPGQVFRECAICPEMVWLPPGEFLMGAPKDKTGEVVASVFEAFAGMEPGSLSGAPEQVVYQAQVKVGVFAASAYEVTFNEYDACVNAGACQFVNDDGWGRDRRPVINVTWDDAQAYVAWLSKETGARYRLLTEAEWEYAARAGTSTTFWWGDEKGAGNAVCDGCGSQWDIKTTAPVGSFRGNAFGLHDTAGNVWEWVEDCYRESLDRQPANGAAVVLGNCPDRVLRGGAWNSAGRYVRPTARQGVKPSSFGNMVGFRVAREA